MSPVTLHPSRWLLFLLLGAGGVLPACTQHPDRAPFLCCAVTCNGSFVRTHKAAPEKGDGGWYCVDGMPIDYEQPCSTEEAPECDDNNSQSGGGNTTPADAGQP